MPNTQTTFSNAVKKWLKNHLPAVEFEQLGNVALGAVIMWRDLRPHLEYYEKDYLESVRLPLILEFSGSTDQVASELLSEYKRIALPDVADRGTIHDWDTAPVIRIEIDGEVYGWRITQLEATDKHSLTMNLPRKAIRDGDDRNEDSDHLKGRESWFRGRH